jgi:MerR family transcriptional regulator/heat shock protein HspR
VTLPRGGDGPVGVPVPRPAAGTRRLDDVHAPMYSLGQAADLLGVGAGFLRRLDGAGLVHPARSQGQHRRYSRAQLQRIERINALVEEGLTVGGAGRVAELEGRIEALEGELAHTRAVLARLAPDRSRG